MALICGVYAEQCLNCVHVLDLAGELLWVGTFSCARSPTFAIIVLLSTVNLHGSLPAFIPLSICSLVALFPISHCLFQTLSPMSCCRIIEQPSHTTLLMLHIIHVLPLSQNGIFVTDSGRNKKKHNQNLYPIELFSLGLFIVSFKLYVRAKIREKPPSLN